MTFEVLENPLTGERAVVRQHAAADNGYLSVGDVYAAPGSAVLGSTYTRARGRRSLWFGDCSA